MGLIDFVKDAGEKLFGHGQAQAAAKESAADPADAAKVQAANSAAGDAILD
jgi:nucleoid-associated protein YgaU